jgi:hypothetical protein
LHNYAALMPKFRLLRGGPNTLHRLDAGTQAVRAAFQL